MNYPWLNNVLDQFSASSDNDRMTHACLLSGPRGLGKIELARKLAKRLLCQKGPQQACGDCHSCRLFESGAHPDFNFLTLEINPRTDKLRTELVIDQVRALNSSMQLTNSISPRKVALIYPAELMNRSTSNALLKTLEEPQGEAVLILVSHQLSQLPATIRSRCQLIHVRLPETQLALEWLITENGLNPDDARIALKASAGSPLQALAIVQDGSLEQFRSVIKTLGRIQNEEAAVADVVTKWAEFDQANLWNWLSLIAANRVRSCFGIHVSTPEKPADSMNKGHQNQLAKTILLLQGLADRNRYQTASSLRKDLLLRDWLIQWSRLPG